MSEPSRHTRYSKNNEIIDKHINDTVGDGYFWSLVGRSVKKKPRACLRCRKVFLSESYGNRSCANCKRVTSNTPYRRMN